MAGRRRTIVAVGGAGFLAAIFCAAGLAATPVRDPHSIACPPPPAGWTTPKNGKTVESPQINANLATEGASDQAEVACDYYSAQAKHLVVSVNYAVPDDVNPITDFYWGCSSAGTPWNTTDRTYRVMSQRQWAIAAFADLNSELSAADVPRFEQVTRQLLQNAEGYGHPCTIKTTPTTMTSNFRYTFRSGSDSGTGSFWVPSIAKPTGAVSVVRVTGAEFTLHVTAAGARRALTLRVVNGLDFTPPSAGHKEQVRLKVRVIGSRVPSCPRGNTGTFTVATASVRLSVCSQVYAPSGATATIQFFY